VYDEGQHPFLRAEGSGDFLAIALRGKTDFPATGASLRVRGRAGGRWEDVTPGERGVRPRGPQPRLATARPPTRP
jgi:hypothetical protein